MNQLKLKKQKNNLIIEYEMKIIKNFIKILYWNYKKITKLQNKLVKALLQQFTQVEIKKMVKFTLLKFMKKLRC